MPCTHSTMPGFEVQCPKQTTFKALAEVPSRTSKSTKSTPIHWLNRRQRGNMPGRGGNAMVELHTLDNAIPSEQTVLLHVSLPRVARRVPTPWPKLGVAGRARFPRSDHSCCLCFVVTGTSARLSCANDSNALAKL